MGGNNCKGFSAKINISGKHRSSGMSDNSDYIEDVVCKESDINENEMKLLPLGDEGKILLIKQRGELHALGTKCTHYGALLHTGALGDGRVRCPWHGACFNIKTGDIEDYPGLDSLPCYKVNIDKNGMVNVRAKRKDLEINRRVKEMCPLKPDNPQTVIIIGGGPAGATCAEKLRQECFTGHIIIINKESILPYDRVKVSKAMDTSAEKLILRSQMFYDEHNIKTKLGVEATGLDVEHKTIKLNNGEEIKYTFLFIATGCNPRKLDVPGSNLKNIYVLRTHVDAKNVHEQLGKEKHIVILGSSFIGMEAAAYCVDKCASVTVIGRDEVPFKPVFGNDIGNRIKKEFQEKGVKFIFGNNIVKFMSKNESDDRVSKVELTDGSIICADIVILGIGSTFYTDWLKGSPLKMLNNGSIEVDEYLKTNVDDIYVGGDIAYAPVYASNNVPATIGHYSLAHYHGKIAALNICGKRTPLRTVPFFWTTLFGKSYRYAGHGRATSIEIHGSLDEFKFFAYHFRDGKVIAMSSVGRDPIVADFANLLYEGKTLSEEEVKQDPTSWIRNRPKDLLTSSKPEPSNTSTQDAKSDLRTYIKKVLKNLYPPSSDESDD